MITDRNNFEKKRMLAAREYHISQVLSQFTDGVTKIIAISESKYHRESKEKRGKAHSIKVLMRYSGKNLHDYYKEKRKRAFKSSYIITQISSVLLVMSEKGIAHMDIKPENVLIDEKSGLIKITDFGSSINFERSIKKIQEPLCDFSERFIGYTRRYCSPEINAYELNSENIKAIIPSGCDVWSFGILSLELLLLEKGVILHTENIITLEDHKKYIQYVIEIMTANSLKEWLGIIIKCLNFKAKDRPNFLEICEDLTLIVKERSSIKFINEAITKCKDRFCSTPISAIKYNDKITKIEAPNEDTKKQKDKTFSKYIEPFNASPMSMDLLDIRFHIQIEKLPKYKEKAAIKIEEDKWTKEENDNSYREESEDEKDITDLGDNLHKTFYNERNLESSEASSLYPLPKEKSDDNEQLEFEKKGNLSLDVCCKILNEWWKKIIH